MAVPIGPRVSVSPRRRTIYAHRESDSRPTLPPIPTPHRRELRTHSARHYIYQEGGDDRPTTQRTFARSAASARGRLIGKKQGLMDASLPRRRLRQLPTRPRRRRRRPQQELSSPPLGSQRPPRSPRRRQLKLPPVGSVLARPAAAATSRSSRQRRR